MNKILYVLTVLFFSQSAYSQFSESNCNFQIAGIFDIHFLDSSNVYVSSGNGTLLSKDSGKNFSEINFFYAQYRMHLINDSSFLCPIFNEFTITTNGGKKWFRKKLVNNSDDTIVINSLFFFDFKIFKNGKGFVTGFSDSSKPSIYITQNEGLTWQLLDSNKYNLTKSKPFANKIYKQFTFDSSVYTLKNGADTFLIKYTNYGSQAQEINLAQKIPVPIRSVQIAFKDELNGLILAYTKTNSYKLYQTIDGANTLTEVTNTTNITNVYYAKASKNKAGFYYGLTDNYPVFSRDDGKTWYQNFDETVLSSYIDFYDAETGIALQKVDFFNYKPFYFEGLQTVGVKNISKNNISVFPNPVNSILNIENIKQAFSYKIINLAGKVILEGTKEATSNQQINTEGLENGIYVLNIVSNEGLFTKKFIKVN